MEERKEERVEVTKSKRGEAKEKGNGRLGERRKIKMRGLKRVKTM